MWVAPVAVECFGFSSVAKDILGSFKFLGTDRESLNFKGILWTH